MTSQVVTAAPKVKTDPQWYYVYELLAEREPGEIVTFKMIENALNAAGKPYHRYTVSSLIIRANKELLKNRSRYAASERGKGYRIVTAEEQLALAKRENRKAGLALERGGRLVTHIRTTELSDETRPLAAAMQLAFARQAEINRRLHNRQVEQQQVIDQMAPDVQRTVADVESLKADMASLKAVLFRPPTTA